MVFRIAELIAFAAVGKLINNPDSYPLNKLFVFTVKLRDCDDGINNTLATLKKLSLQKTSKAHNLFLTLPYTL
jgi:hypothetical protein